MPRSYFRVRTIRPSARYHPPGADVMRQIGDAIIPRIVQRTRSGLDEDRRRFAPYAARSKKAGKRVNLTETGAMLDGITVVSAGPKTLRLGWTDRSRATIAGYHQGGTEAMPARPFFAFPKQWAIDALRKFYRPWKP